MHLKPRKRKEGLKDKLKRYASRAGLGALIIATAVPLMASPLVLADSATVTFEPPTYRLGDINGQDGWQKTGDYDVAVDTNNVSDSFGLQSLRISNARTTQAFGDQTFSRPVAEAAGETGSEGETYSGAAQHKFFTSSFDLSSTKSTEQPGLLMSVSPDRGDGARMSYLRFEDKGDGIHVNFNEYKDAAPLGSVTGDATQGCGAGDDFVDSDIATVSRSAPHRITSVMEFKDGPHNDVVKVYVDGALKKTGTSWEDYFRYCEDNETRTVDSVLFRVAGEPALATQGSGFLVDNLQLSSADEAPKVPKEPTNKDLCKNDGYKNVTDQNGTTFKNQGQCVSYYNGRTSLGNKATF